MQSCLPSRNRTSFAGSGFWGFMTSIHRPSLTKQPFCYTKFESYFCRQDLKKMPSGQCQRSSGLRPSTFFQGFADAPEVALEPRNVNSTRTRFHNFLKNTLNPPPPVVNIAEAHGLARPVKKGHVSNVTNVLTIEYQRCDEKVRGLPS